MELEFSFGKDAHGGRIEERPFRILVLGNFSGHAADSAGAEPLARRRIAAVDFETLDALWEGFAPELRMELDGAEVVFRPRDLDDFHPDRLYAGLAVFADLRETRKALLDPATAQATLEGLLTQGDSEAADASAAEEPGAKPSAEDSGEMFERLLGKPASTPERRAAPKPPPQFEGFIRRIVAPHIVDDPDPRVETAIDSIDRTISELMRGLLHHPEFQALEACWRSLHDLVSGIELDENLQLFACDVHRQDLLMGLPDPGSSLAESGIFELLVNRNQARDDDPWTVIVSDEAFADSREDIAILTALGAAAAANGGVVLGAASPTILGCEDVHDLSDPKRWSGPAEDSLWKLLRESDVADRIGLALPRVLARIPYGADTDPTAAFDFEEMPEHQHAGYLWASPARACARLLAESFTHEGWNLEPQRRVDLGPLPAHTYAQDGETHLKPCAEVLIPESAMVAIIDHGLMPLISYRDRNTAVVGRFQSIASPPAPLNGPWAG